jgi:hypothetical protein
MAVTDLRTLLDAGTAVTNWVDAAGAATGTASTEVFPPGAAGSVTDKVSKTIDGLLYNAGATGSFAAGDHIYMWYSFLFGALDTVAGAGIRFRVTGATVTDWAEVTVDGSDSGKSGWQLAVVSVDRLLANPTLTNGTPPTAANIQRAGIIFDITDSVGGNNDNVGVQAIYRQPASVAGAYRVDAGTDVTPNTWATVVSEVAIDTTGVVIEEPNGTITLNGPIVFGPAAGNTDTTFEDTGVVLAWNNNEFVAKDFYKLAIDLPVSYIGDARITAGIKVGSGETAVGVSGWTIVTGGPSYTMEFENADQTDIQFYGCSFQGSGVWSINDPAVEIISCIFSNCDQLTVSGGAGGPTLLSNFFSDAPGPGAQIKWGNATTASNGQFDFNSFVNMKWWAIEFDTAGTYDLRGVVFSGNGTDRDLIATHETGTVTVNVLEQGSTPGGTNGATITVTTAGASDIRVTAVGLDNVEQTTPVSESNGANTIAAGDPLTAAVTANDANSYLAAIYGADRFGTVDWSGSGAYVEQVEANSDIGTSVTGGATKEAVTGSQTASADHSGTVANAALTVFEVDNSAASPVTEVDPEWRPVDTTLASTTHVFGYGVATDLDTPSTLLGAFVMVHTQDPTAADTNVTSVSWGGTSMTEVREDFADDSGGGGEGLRTTVFQLVGSNLRKGTFTIVASVPLEVNGVSEGAQCYMEADGVTGPLPVGTLIMNEAADSAGVAGTTFGGTTPQGVVVRARGSGTVGGVVSVDNGAGTETNQTTEARDRGTTNDVGLMPGGGTTDIIYIGAIDEFERVNIDIGTAGTGAYTLTWEYWNGAWVSLSVVDATGDFKNVGSNRVTFTAPGDWTTTSVTTDVPAGTVGPFYFIRARGDAGGITIEPLGNHISVAEGNTVKYLPFQTTGEIATGTGLTVTAVWLPDTIAS